MTRAMRARMPHRELKWEMPIKVDELKEEKYGNKRLVR